SDLVLGGIRHGDVAGDSPLMRATGTEFFASRHERLQDPGLPIPATEAFAGHLSVKAEHARDTGGFDESFTGYGCEDWDFGQRLIDRGARVAYLPEAMVAHRSRITRQRWLRDARDEAASQLLLIDKHPALASETDLGGLFSSSLLGRMAAHLAMHLPGFGRVAGAAFFELAEAAEYIRLRTTARHLLAHSFRAVYWSAVAREVGSAREARRRFEFHARVLCYHRVTDTPNPALAEWAVTPRQLEEHMQFLARKRYTAVTCSELIRRFKTGEATARLVAITFDDGYEDTVTAAAPILVRAGFVATVFAVTDRIGKTAEWDAAFGGEMAPLATAEQLNSLAAVGWEIGHHTATHPDLTSVADAQLSVEMGESWHALQRSISAPVTTFAYPYAAYDARVMQAALACGYAGAFGIGTRWASPQSRPGAIERVFVLSRHSLPDFRMLLWIGLDRRDLVRHVVGMPLRLLRRPSVTG
ncbi:MAG: polysaccharide deacetylase family protein, partial [Chloroflexota bacterium]|nr:polysaccharide deacetylase family protein [Chloroflexota bacterium]